MCFLINKTERTKRRIVCYKILRVYKDGTIHSPYYITSWKINKEQKTKLTKRESKNTNYVYSTNGFYTYKSMLTALKALSVFESKTKAKFKIFRCIIPKDTKCYFGQGQICSEKLIVKRKLIFNLI